MEILNQQKGKSGFQDELKHIIEGCARHERRSQQLIYEKYMGICITTALRYVDTYDKAADVSHDAFLKIFRHFDRFEIRDEKQVEGALVGWIKKIVTRVAIDSLRRQARRVKWYGMPAQDRDYPDGSQKADNGLLYRELFSLVKDLPPSYKRVFQLFVVDGYSHPESPRCSRSLAALPNPVSQKHGCVCRKKCY